MGHMIDKKPLRVVTKKGEFAGKPMLYIHKLSNLDEVDPKSLLQFGLQKAEAILLALDDIKAFVEANKK